MSKYITDSPIKGRQSMDEKELQEIIRKHKLWLNGEAGGERADLSFKDLSGMDLSNVDLHFADLRCANLCGANLSRANLEYANLDHAILEKAILNYTILKSANLSYTQLSHAELNEANLSNANLNVANLSSSCLHAASLVSTYLQYSNLVYANLTRAFLHKTNMCGATLCCANFTGAFLDHADLSYCNLKGAKLEKVFLDSTEFRNVELNNEQELPYIPMTCPDEGSFIGWKQAEGYIVKLEIPADARRSSSSGRKCRCDKAKVLAIENFDGSPSNLTEIRSDYTGTFLYKVGEIVEEPHFCENRWTECAEGIHFFMNRQEAIDYFR